MVVPFQTDPTIDAVGRGGGETPMFSPTVRSNILRVRNGHVFFRRFPVKFYDSKPPVRVVG